ncbi:hypothetical protein M0802_003774 [Mischocyttarus mexicanus]|nr:hypothetical protein M0802_003774 [Mischocyttarus mexicanus]
MDALVLNTYLAMFQIKSNDDNDNDNVNDNDTDDDDGTGDVCNYDDDDDDDGGHFSNNQNTEEWDHASGYASGGVNRNGGGVLLVMGKEGGHEAEGRVKIDLTPLDLSSKGFHFLSTTENDADTLLGIMPLYHPSIRCFTLDRDIEM